MGEISGREGYGSMGEGNLGACRTMSWNNKMKQLIKKQMRPTQTLTVGIPTINHILFCTQPLSGNL